VLGIVLVSHSAALAEGLAGILRQLAGDAVAIVPAGGAPDGGIGTSPDAIQAAVERADAGDGVLVLVDMGSAVLSVRIVLEGHPDPARVRLVDAPLVEGAVAAAMTASFSTDIDAAAQAAEEAWHVRKLPAAV
jgi:PTS hybrid protein